MKEVILSADGDSFVYRVPDDVAENLSDYCIEFCDRWMKTSPEAKKYKIRGGYYFDQSDFIDYLNRYVFPDEKSVLVKNLGFTDLGKRLPANYKNHPNFNF